MPHVAIIYGFGEGPTLGGPLRTALHRAGFAVTHDVTKADCIVTHSAGYLFLPHYLQAKVVFMIAPSAGHAHTSLAKVQIRKVINDIRAHGFIYFAKKSLRNLRYMASQPHRNSILLLRAKKMGRKLPLCHAERVALLAYPDDPWSEAIAPDEIKQHKSYCYMQRPGDHDDLWAHPADYVRILQYLYDA